MSTQMIKMRSIAFKTDDSNTINIRSVAGGKDIGKLCEIEIVELGDNCAINLTPLQAYHLSLVLAKNFPKENLGIVENA